MADAFVLTDNQNVDISVDGVVDKAGVVIAGATVSDLVFATSDGAKLSLTPKDDGKGVNVKSLGVLTAVDPDDPTQDETVQVSATGLVDGNPVVGMVLFKVINSAAAGLAMSPGIPAENS